MPDAEGDDASQSGRDTGSAVDSDFSVDQFGRVPASLQIVIGPDLVKVRVGDDEGDHRDRQYGDGGIIDAFRT